MKKQVLLIVVLISIIATSAAFAQQPTLDKMTFTMSNNHMYYVARAVNRQISGQVVIPGTYEGTTVRAVDFRDNPNITSVVMLNGVSYIGSSAFQGCTGLTSVTIPNTVTVIDGEAFRGCTGLTSIVIPASVTAILNNAFNGCTNLTSVTIQPSSIHDFTNIAFDGDLRDKYRAASGGPGTYTRQRGGTVWTKQGTTVSSIDGTWRSSDGVVFIIAGSAGKSTPYATLSSDGRTLTIGGTTFTKQ